MSTKECRDINELHPKVKELAEKLVAECKKQGINLKIGETYRTVARQDYLYAQGRTRAGAIVTNAKGSDMASYHQWRLAFDVFINEKGNEYNTTLLNKAGKIGQSLGLEWGGSWKSFKDTPHYQYTYGLTIKQLKAGAKIPSYTPKVEDKELTSAVDKMNKAGVIGSPEVWNDVDKIVVKNLQPLVTKFCRVVLGKTLSYEQAVDLLVEKKIISNDKLWKDFTAVKATHIRSLLIKLSTLI